MKSLLMAGATAALIWGVPALADDYPQQGQTTTHSESTTTTTDQTTTPTAVPPPNTATPEVAPPAYTPPAYTEAPPVQKVEPNAMRGVTLLVGGGVEGYTGALSSEIRPGGTWGAEVALKPTKVLGLEIGYTGAANYLSSSTYASATDIGLNGPDIIRNGGQAVATVGLTAFPVQPYLLGGLGLDHFSIRGGQSAGFRDDNNGNIPLGAGLRSHTGNFTADLRFDYHLPLSQTFAPGINSGDLGAGRYQGMLQVGATF